MSRFKNGPYEISAKAASYTVTTGDFGKFFTTRGATGAITFTLPAVTAGMAGAAVEFFNIADQDMIVAGTAGELVTFNDAAANSVATSTSSEQIGSHIKAICDGTSWLIILSTEETQTATVAT